MNKPIGVPSGWEEIAAFCSFMASTSKWGLCADCINAKTSGAYYDHIENDWRVVE